MTRMIAVEPLPPYCVDAFALLDLALDTTSPQTLARRASAVHRRHAFFPRIPLLALRASVAGATSKRASEGTSASLPLGYVKH